MSKQNKRSAPPASSDGKTVSEEAARAVFDRNNDPLFVLHLDELERAGLERTVGQDIYPDLMETICGIRDDSQPVEQYNGALGVSVAFVNAHQSAVCQVQWNNNLASIFTNPGNVSGVRWGSGTMITNDLMLTCGHLFDQTGGGWQRPRVNGTSNIISPQDIARNMHVNFNFQVDSAGNLRAEQSFPILELIEYRLGGIDMAICRIGGNPGATFGRTVVSSTDAAVPDMICIIGHPAGQPKRIEAGPTTQIDGNLIRYSDIDTLGGNSGSGILRASDGRLVGIHTNGGCTSASPSPGGGSNFGQRIEAVIAVSPTLQGLLRPTLKFIDDGGVRPTLKFRDDTPSLKFIDDGGGIPTLKFRDDAPSLKFRDDVKAPGLDKQPGFDNKLPAFDGNGGFDPGTVINPGIRPEAQPARPFIMSTPHHSYAWQSYLQSSAGEQQQLESALMHYEQAMAALEAQLQQLDQEYRQVRQQYETYQQGGGQQ